jgi:putative oxidoreductase
MTTGTLILRALIGGLFVGHGLQKLKGWFGGGGIDGTAQMMEATGMRPARRNAVAAGITETAGGAALALGVLTPVASAGLISVMLTAIRKVHWSKGVWNHDGGYEYNAVLIAAVAALAGDGPGAASIDAAFGRRRWGVLGMVFALAAGAAGSIGAVELGRRSAPVAAPEEDEASAA